MIIRLRALEVFPEGDLQVPFHIYLHMPDEYRMTLRSNQMTKIFFLNSQELKICNLDKTGTCLDSPPH